MCKFLPRSIPSSSSVRFRHTLYCEADSCQEMSAERVLTVDAAESRRHVEEHLALRAEQEGSVDGAIPRVAPVHELKHTATRQCASLCALGPPTALYFSTAVCIFRWNFDIQTDVFRNIPGQSGRTQRRRGASCCPLCICHWSSRPRIQQIPCRPQRRAEFHQEL